MRTTRALSLFLFCVASACGLEEVVPYHCPTSCQEHARAIAQYGSSPDGEPLDESTVCAHESLASATNCGECIDAISETYRLYTAEIGCHCPEASVNEGKTMLYWNGACEYVEDEVNSETCALYNATRNENPEECF